MREALRLDRFLDQFVIGSLVFLGVWYMHRPFLLEYFPRIAGNVPGAPNELELQLALVLFAIGSVCCGVLITHLSDVAVIAVFKDGAESEKSRRRHRVWLRQAARVFTLWPSSDPRLRAIRRYLESNRREPFLEMMASWALTEPEWLKSPSECVVAHQHLVVHLKTASPRTKVALEEAYAPVAFSVWLFVALCALTFISVLSFWTSSIVEPRRIFVLFNSAKWTITGAFYVGAVLTGFSFRRRFREFCGAVVALSLHFNRAGTAVYEPASRGMDRAARLLP